MMIRPACLPLLAVALAACATDRPAARSHDALADSAPAAAQQPAPVDSLPPAPAAAGAITLAADGLEVAGGPGAARRLAFGDGRARVLAEVGGVLGPPSEQGTMEECPSGPLYQVGYPAGMQLSFQDSAFVGWFARQNSEQRTARGIGPGSTLAQLRAAYPGHEGGGNLARLGVRRRRALRNRHRHHRCRRRRGRIRRHQLHLPLNVPQ